MTPGILPVVSVVLFKRADLFVPPPRYGRQGGRSGYSAVDGWLNGGEAMDFVKKHNPQLYADGAAPGQQAFAQEAAKDNFFSRSVAPIGSWTMAEPLINAGVRKFTRPAATALGRYALGQNTAGLMFGPVGVAGGYLANKVIGDPASEAVGRVRFQRDPSKYMAAGAEKMRPYLSSATASQPIRYNPWQQALLSLDENPYARSALAGGGLGAAGGALLGGAAGHPVIGALLGLLAGGAAGGNSPKFGQGLWQKIYDAGYGRPAPK